MHHELKKFLILGGVILLISGGLLALRFGGARQVGTISAALPTYLGPPVPNVPGNDPQYIFVRKAPSCINCFRWNGNGPKQYSTAALDEIIDAIGTRGTPNRRLGVGALFEPSYIDVGRTRLSLINLLRISLERDFPIYISLDNYNYWESRPNLWYWWEPGISDEVKAARKANVEWSDWDGDTNDANALQISWTNWGFQFRRPPGPNLLSPAYIQNSIDTLNQLVPVISDWYRQLPADKKYLLGGVDFGNEVEIGANFYYYPNGNSYLNLPPENDPHPTNFLASSVQTGYAALKTGNIKSSGTITTEDLNLAVNRYLDALTQYAYNAGIPRNKIFNHTGGKGTSPDGSYPEYPAFTDLRSTLMPYSYPGWSLYGNKTDPQNDSLLNSVLDQAGAAQWASPEWLPFVTTSAEWLAAIRNTMNYRNNRLINIANWEDIRSNPDALEAIRTALGESSTCWVNSPVATVATTSNSAVLSWTGGENMAARYLNITTNPALRTDGMFQTVDVVNNNVTDQNSFTASNWAPGTYYWLLASDGCDPVQRRVEYGSFSVIAATPSPLATPGAISGTNRGDANGDGMVDMLDFGLVINHFNETGADISGDVNHDGKVDIIDFGLIVNFFWR